MLKHTVVKVFYLSCSFIGSFLSAGSRFVGRDAHDDFSKKILRSMKNRKVNLPSVSAVYRVKNGSKTLPLSIYSILPICSEIIVVDNSSDDDTLEILRQLRLKLDNVVDFKIFTYDSILAAAGDGYGDSLKFNSGASLADYYNFCFSKASCDYVFKADAHCIYLPHGLWAIQNKVAAGWDVVWSRGDEVFGHCLRFEPRLYLRNLKFHYRDGDSYEILSFPKKYSFLYRCRATIFAPVFIHVKRIFYAN